MTMMGQQPLPPQQVAVAAAFGDTTLTKVFVGGLAWETHKDTLREHFESYGDILEAVIISDKLTGRSKGYGFVTFKEADAAKKACEDATPVINGRRANCNLASLGAKPRPHPPHLLRPSPPATPAPHAPSLPSPHQPAPAIAVGSRGVSPVPWYYHPSTTPPPPPPAAHYAAHGAHQQYHGVLPFYPPRHHLRVLSELRRRLELQREAGPSGGCRHGGVLHAGALHVPGGGGAGRHVGAQRHDAGVPVLPLPVPRLAGAGRPGGPLLPAGLRRRRRHRPGHHLQAHRHGPSSQSGAGDGLQLMA